jgi:hybrid cluster-associated redox disulfide protein
LQLKKIKLLLYYNKDVEMSEQETKISKNMTFGELLKQFPKAGPVLMGYGLHCVGCHIGVTETIEEGARAHGLDDDRIESMMKDLNEQAVQ